jgi:membrane protease YdiL (CAAX protease family)
VLFNPRTFLALEFFILCLLIPGLIIGFRYGVYMFAFLWAATLYAFLVMAKTRTRAWREIWGWGQVNWVNLKPVLIRWSVASVLMVGFLYLYNPHQLFSLARERPEFLPVLFTLYPLISALPQEFLFCSFFFHRYKPFFGNGLKMVVASALVFAFAHILYINPVAPVLSLAGGLIFAQTYRKTRSLALVTIEHGLYGNALFLIGLGIYFYSGNVPTG